VTYNGSVLNDCVDGLNAISYDLRGELHYEISNSVNDFVVYIDKVTHNVADAMYVTEKMDSGASTSMSGDVTRIVTELPLDTDVRIIGFNGTKSSPAGVGLNSDGKKEFFVPSMPENLALLSAHSYAVDGAVVLLGDGGAVLQLSASELECFKHSLGKYRKTKELCVNNRTYEVCPTDDQATSTDNTRDCSTGKESADLEAMSNTAVRFFNHKVNVSNKTERILTLLMTGLSFRDLYSHVQNGSMEGMPPDLTISALNHFEHQYGRTPEIIQLAIARNPGHRQGLMDTRPRLTYCGERYEIDCLEADTFTDGQMSSRQRSMPRKLASHGGAIAGVVGIDCFSGFVHGKLLKSTGNSLEFVKELLARVELEG